MNPSSRWHLFLVIAALAVVAAGGGWYYRAEQRALLRQAVDQLRSIAQLKSDEIVRWRAERLADAAVLTESPGYNAAVRQWLAAPGSPVPGSLLEGLRSLRRHHGYTGINIVDADRRLCYSLEGRRHPLSPAALQALPRAWQRRRPVLIDLHTDPATRPHLGLAVPHFAAPTPDAPPIGATLLQIDPDDFLYPLVQAWPVPQRSAETLLVRSDGDSVLFLNELRHQAGTALSLRLPLSRGDLPAVMAITGTEGLVRGRDYRDVPVLAVLAPVPDTPWHLVAKVDADEALALRRHQSTHVLLLILGALGSLGALALALYQREIKAAYRDMLEIEQAAASSRRVLDFAIQQIPVPVIIAAAPDVAITHFNPPARELLERDPGDLTAIPLADHREHWPTFYPDGTPYRIEDLPLTRAVQRGDVTRDAEIIVRRSDGDHWIQVTAAPLCDEAGRIVAGIVAFPEITERKRALQALERNQRILDATGHMARIGGWEHDLVTGEATWTRALYDIIEIPPGQAPPGVAEHLSYYPEPDRQLLRQAYETAVHQGTPFDLELQVHTSSGRPIWCRAQGEPVYREGTCVAMRGTFQDITPRKQTELTLQETTQRLEEAQRIAHIGHWEIDSDVGTPVWSDEIFRIFGLDPGEGEPSFTDHETHVHPDDWPALDRAVRRGAADGTPFDLVFRILRPGGQIAWMQAIGTASRDDTGRVTRLFGTAQDITPRKRAEIALQETTGRLQEAQRIARMGDFTWSPDTGEVTWSDGLFELLQYDRSEVLDLTRIDTEIHHPEDLDRVSTWLAESLASGRTELPPNEYRVVRRDGEVLTVRTTGVIRRAAGGSPTVFATVQDVTELRRAEEERQRLEEQLGHTRRLEAVGRLAGGVAHDFNNMLHAILGHCDLAARQVHSGHPLGDHLARIRQAAEHSANLTRQLLGFARQQTHAPQVLNLNDTVATALRMLRRLLGENIDLAWVPDPDAWTCLVDPTQVEQVLSNLCLNARDAIDGNGSITIETGNASLDQAYCDSHPGFRPGDYVVLVVSDNGRGMDAETLANVFEPFFTTKARGEGTGLGLATVYGIVKQNDGFVNAYSEPGQGSTFRIYLPRRTDDVDGTATAEQAPTPEMPRGTETVLLVEDEPTILEMGRTFLAELGYTVLTARAPSAALEAAAHSGDIHVLVTDVVMPEMNGRDLAERLVAQRPDLRVAFMSGYTANVIAHHGILDEGVHLLQKPFSQDELARLVRRVLDD